MRDGVGREAVWAKRWSGKMAIEVNRRYLEFAAAYFAVY